MTDQAQPRKRRPSNLRDVTYGVQSSRRLLIKTIRALAVFSDAITVIGAHADYPEFVITVDDTVDLA